MTKEQFIEEVMAKATISKKDAKNSVNAVLDILTEKMAAGETVSFVGFGSFGSSMRAAKTGRNPKTLEEISIPAKSVPRFKPGKALKDAVAG